MLTTTWARWALARWTTLLPIAGIVLLAAAWRRGVSVGVEIVVAALLTGDPGQTCLMLPTFTTSAEGPVFSSSQLTFAALASLVLYVAFVTTQTVRHRDFFLPVAPDGTVLSEHAHAEPPTDRAALRSLTLLIVALVAVVGLAKVESHAIETLVAKAGLPHTVVGVVIALLSLTVVVSVLTIVPGRATRLQGSLHLVILAVYVFLAGQP